MKNEFDKEQIKQEFREYLKKYEERELNEMPKYIDHDYLGFEPIEDKSMQFLEAKWKEIKTYSAKTKQLDSDVKIFTTNSKGIAIIGLTQWDKVSKSWNLEIASYVKLERTSYGYYKVRAVFTKEDFRGSRYTASLYYSLVKSGILLCSDNEQYQGAKPLWKALSRLVPVEIYDERTEEVFDYNMDIEDDKVWSKGYQKFDKVLRVKDL